MLKTVKLVACVGRFPNGDWEYVLWVPSINLSWIVKAEGTIGDKND